MASTKQMQERAKAKQAPKQVKDKPWVMQNYVSTVTGLAFVMRDHDENQSYNKTEMMDFAASGLATKMISQIGKERVPAFLNDVMKTRVDMEKSFDEMYGTSISTKAGLSSLTFDMEKYLKENNVARAHQILIGLNDLVIAKLAVAAQKVKFFSI